MVSQDVMKQKQSALSMKKLFPDVEEIYFSKSGGHTNGAGNWYIGADIKIADEWHGVGAATDGIGYTDETFPERKIHIANQEISEIQIVKVVYSDGSMEIL